MKPNPNIEIERKFLVSGEDWKKGAVAVRIRQGYLSLDEQRTVRVRFTDGTSWLTIKGIETGQGRAEFEYEIPGDEAETLLDTLCLHPTLDKIRYTLHHAGKEWVVDEFLSENEGLRLAEVELTAMDEDVELPPWIDREVTGDSRYYNSSLIQSPFSCWK